MQKARIPAFLAAAAVLGADLATKSWAFASFPAGEPTWVFPRWFAFTPVMNPGITGGMLRNVSPVIVTVLTLGAAVAVTAYILLSRGPGKLTLGSLSVILGGAAGNLYDRFAFGQVRDFIDVRPGLRGLPWLDRWPTFNVADSAIVVGVLLLLVHSLFFGREMKPGSASGDSPG